VTVVKRYGRRLGRMQVCFCLWRLNVAFYRICSDSQTEAYFRGVKIKNINRWCSRYSLADTPWGQLLADVMVWLIGEYQEWHCALRTRCMLFFTFYVKGRQPTLLIPCALIFVLPLIREFMLFLILGSSAKFEIWFLFQIYGPFGTEYATL